MSRKNGNKSVGELLGNPALSTEVVPEELQALSGKDTLTFKQLLMLEAFRTAIKPSVMNGTLGSILRKKDHIRSALKDAIVLARYTGEVYEMITADEQAMEDE